MAVPGQQNTINGTAEGDLLKGSPYDDLIRGGAGNDILLGRKGGDALYGGEGNDILLGGKGDDWLIGGAGNDLLLGGAGADQFRFDARGLTGHDCDLVADLNFKQGDKLVLYGFAPGTFDDKDGIVETSGGNDLDITVPYTTDPSQYGSGAVIDSYADLAELAKYSSGVSASRLGCTNTLVLTIDNAEFTQTIYLAGAYQGFAQAGGVLA